MGSPEDTYRDPPISGFSRLLSKIYQGLLKDHQAIDKVNLENQRVRLGERIRRGISNKDKVIAYASRQLKKYAKNYTTRDLELEVTSLISRILEAQREAMKKENLEEEAHSGANQKLETRAHGIRLRYSIHPGADKMYMDVKEYYRWSRMKKDIAFYVGKCSTCAKVKAEHQKLSGLLQQLKILVCKWEKITMDLVTRSPLCWLETRDRQLTRLDVIQEPVDKIIAIKERLKIARSQPKSYADNRRKPLEFQVGDQVLLKVSPWKGMIRFGKRGKLNPRYTGPFKKCLTDETLIVPLKELKITNKLQFVEEPLEIMDREVKRLKQSRIPNIKVRWNSQRGPEFTREREDEIKRFILTVGGCDNRIFQITG
ncbi:putative reverse transcriptase domain-containing protein [Tanacetum coccineum]